MQEVRSSSLRSSTGQNHNSNTRAASTAAMTAEVTVYLFHSPRAGSWPLLASLPECEYRRRLRSSGQGKRPIAGTAAT